MQDNKAGNIHYEAFISYRHMAHDIAVAKALHKQLETYRIPAYIKKRTGKAKMGKFFRDQDELPLLSDLGEGIRQALENSDWLIVVCTPDLPQSKWCMAEVDYFIKLGKQDKILTVLAAGEPAESFPPQLRFIQNAAGDTVEKEPLAADVRADSLKKTLGKVRREKLRLLAPMLGVGYDDLRRRQRERTLRLALATSLVAVAFFAAFGGYTLHQSGLISQQNQKLAEQKTQLYAGSAKEQLAAGNRAGAGVLALRTLPREGSPLLPAAKNAIYDAAYRPDKDIKPLMKVPTTNEVVVAPDGKTFVTSEEDYMRVYEVATFRLIYEHRGRLTATYAYVSDVAKGAEVYWAAYHKNSDTVFLPNGKPVFANVRTGQVVKEGLFSDVHELADYGLSRYEVEYPRMAGPERDRVVVDLASGEEIFAAVTPQRTCKTLFSPDDKYFIVATGTILDLYDVEKREKIGSLPQDSFGILNGYTFFSPDARYLVVTNEAFRDLPVTQTTLQAMRAFRIRVLEVPSLRIIYEDTLYKLINGARDLLTNDWRNSSSSRMGPLLFSPDSTRLIVPRNNYEYGMLDLEKEELLFTHALTPIFASFSPDGETYLDVSRSGNNIYLYNAKTGAYINSEWYRALNADMGFFLGDTNQLLLSGETDCRIMTVSEKKQPEARQFFSDDSERFILPATEGKNAVIVDSKGKAADIVLEDSEGYTLAEYFVATGDTVVGLHAKEYIMQMSSWDAATGKRLVSGFQFGHDPVTTSLRKIPPFYLSRDGKRMTSLFGWPEAAVGGFTSFDARSGERLGGIPGEHKHCMALDQDMTILPDRDLTRLLWIFGSKARVFDAPTGKLLFVLDDYPVGDTAITSWFGLKGAIRDDGTLIALSYEKKESLEIVDATTGQRLYDLPLGASATTPPCFSHDGKRVAIAAGQHLFMVDVDTGKVLYSVFEMDGLSGRYAFSEDDQFLVGPDIRRADTGLVECPVPLPARPAWEIKETAGIKIPMEKSQVIYLPSVAEAIEKVKSLIREYEFTTPEKIKYALD